MKKFFAIIAISASLSACHYGREEAEKTLKANETYKSEQAGFSVNRANVSASTEQASDTSAMPADTAAKTK